MSYPLRCQKLCFLFQIFFLASCGDHLGYKNKEVDNHFECSYYQYDRFVTTELGVDEIKADDRTVILSENQLAPDRVQVEINQCVYEDTDDDVIEPTITGATT